MSDTEQGSSTHAATKKAAAPAHNAQAVTTADERRTEVEEEYGTYVATEQIVFGTTPAFNIGDPVPKSHVDRGIVTTDQVAKRDTKAALRAAATAGGIETGD